MRLSTNYDFILSFVELRSKTTRYLLDMPDDLRKLDWFHLFAEYRYQSATL